MRTVFRLIQPGGADGNSRTEIGVFAASEEAELIGKSGYGNTAPPRCNGGLGVDWKIEEIHVYDSLEEFLLAHEDASTPVELLQKQLSALAKLDPEDIKALGLTDLKQHTEQ